jgi:hypothetical protein
MDSVSRALAITWFEELHNEVQRLSGLWVFYKGIYGDPETFDLIKQTTANTFGQFQDPFQSDIIRRVCAITDEEGKGKNQNLCLKRLWNACREYIPDDQVSAGDEVFVKLEASMRQIRPLRNKTLAHFDLREKTGDEYSFCLPRGEHVQKAIDMICEIMAMISLEMRGINVSYQNPLMNRTLSSLRWTLSDSLRLKKLNRLAKDDSVSSETIRQLAKHRSDRWDDEILYDSG